jgi:hypothetical protein
MHTPIPALKGRTPIAVMTEGDIDTILRILGTLVSNAFI